MGGFIVRAGLFFFVSEAFFCAQGGSELAGAARGGGCPAGRGFIENLIKFLGGPGVLRFGFFFVLLQIQN